MATEDTLCPSVCLSVSFKFLLSELKLLEYIFQIFLEEADVV